MGFDRLPVVRAEESNSATFMGRQGTDLPVPMFSIGIRAEPHSPKDDCRASAPEASGPKGRGRGSRITARLKSCPDELRREIHDGGESKWPCHPGSSLVTCHSSLLLGSEIHAAQEVLKARIGGGGGHPEAPKARVGN